MKQIKTNFSIHFFVAGFLLMLVFSGTTSAEMESTNFKIKSDVIGSFGSDSASTNFQLNDTGGETGGGFVGGTNNSLWGGFWNNVLGETIIDTDGDGIADGVDNCPNVSNPTQSDSDGDGVGNACDNCRNNSNSNQSDSDGDGVGNACDNCRNNSNSNQSDSDNDGIGNACDNCPSNYNVNQTDSDGDGIGNSCDNCATVSNSNQQDTDGDGVGDACEPPVDNDTDNDGILNSVDNCLLVYNPAQGDIDSNGIGDVCDSDMDGDGVINASDNCPVNSNADQKNTDGDSIGDVCDSDMDGDGVANTSDNCQLVANPDQKDADNDGTGDECDSDMDGDGVANTSDNCPLVANPGQEDSNGNGVGDVCDAGIDTDGDGIDNNADNCPLVSNPDQADIDNDDIGDACDLNNNTPVKEVKPKDDLENEEEEKEEGVLQLLGVPDDNIKQIASAVKRTEEQVTKNKNLIATTTAAVATASLLPVFVGISSFKDIFLIIANSFGSLFGLIFRRRRDWGIVYDVDTGEPISLVSVEIINNLGRNLDRKVTDKMGSYVFLVPQGKYSLVIEKEGYLLADRDAQFKTSYSDNYYGGELDIQNPDAISFNIPLRSLAREGKNDLPAKNLVRSSLLSRFVFSLTTMLFYAGFILSIISFFILPDKKMTIAVLAAYALGILLRKFAMKERGWGKILGLAGEVSPFATVRAFNKMDGSFVARTISDELGRYSLILRKGEYGLTVDGVNGEKWSGDIRVNRTAVVKKKIKLENNPSPFMNKVEQN